MSRWKFLINSQAVFVCVVVGGLLSAHLLARRAGMELEPGWPCSGPLLRMAEDAARKLLPGEDVNQFTHTDDFVAIFFSDTSKSNKAVT